MQKFGNPTGSSHHHRPYGPPAWWIRPPPPHPSFFFFRPHHHHQRPWPPPTNSTMRRYHQQNGSRNGHQHHHNLQLGEAPMDIDSAESESSNSGSSEDVSALGPSTKDKKDKSPTVITNGEVSSKTTFASDIKPEVSTMDTAANVNSDTIYVDGLSQLTNWIALADIFRQFGSLQNVTVFKNHWTGHNRGRASVQFVKPEDACRAFEQQNLLDPFSKRPLKLFRHNPTLPSNGNLAVQSPPKPNNNTTTTGRTTTNSCPIIVISSPSKATCSTALKSDSSILMGPPVTSTSSGPYSPNPFSISAPKNPDSILEKALSMLSTNSGPNSSGKPSSPIKVPNSISANPFSISMNSCPSTSSNTVLKKAFSMLSTNSESVTTESAPALTSSGSSSPISCSISAQSNSNAGSIVEKALSILSTKSTESAPTLTNLDPNSMETRLTHSNPGSTEPEPTFNPDSISPANACSPPNSIILTQSPAPSLTICLDSSPCPSPSNSVEILTPDHVAVTSHGPPLPPYPKSPDPCPPPPPPPPLLAPLQNASESEKCQSPFSRSIPTFGWRERLARYEPRISRGNEDNDEKEDNRQDAAAVIVIRGLRSIAANEMRVRGVFSLFGKIGRVKVCRKRKKARVYFENKEEAWHAIQTMDGTQWWGREVQCRWWRDGKKTKKIMKFKKKKKNDKKSSNEDSGDDDGDGDGRKMTKMTTRSRSTQRGPRTPEGTPPPTDEEDCEEGGMTQELDHLPKTSCSSPANVIDIEKEEDDDDMEETEEDEGTTLMAKFARELRARAKKCANKGTCE